ncbi:uncharacterized protein BDZ99DRAFT_185166 [Mytilinidion resinicola]|uniref:Uncharacterized protein n=1 Tax=Mytilinidion resinicola TaxID=574789 RepID=A0A6A6Z0X1_9PEZI|nr:uncharacterized protein BDZ99DRAFT_185166 [Mytilinidion resinicola]KAF2814812.1 hypothetical protein BDZ99DRAFT_185166 [Mytilinidion resinicola]
MEPAPPHDEGSARPGRTLCDYCQGFEKLVQKEISSTAKPRTFYTSMNHQPSLYALQASADGGCDMCKSLNTQMLAAAEHKEPMKPSTSPIFMRIWNQDIWWEGETSLISIYDREHGSTVSVTLEPFFDVCSGHGGREPEQVSQSSVAQCFAKKNFPGRSVDANPSSTRTISFIKRCLSECLENHDACRSAIQAQLPQRVIDVGNQSGSSGIRLLVDAQAKSDYL